MTDDHKIVKITVDSAETEGARITYKFPAQEIHPDPARGWQWVSVWLVAKSGEPSFVAVDRLLLYVGDRLALDGVAVIEFKSEESFIGIGMDGKKSKRESWAKPSIGKCVKHRFARFILRWWYGVPA